MATLSAPRHCVLAAAACVLLCATTAADDDDSGKATPKPVVPAPTPSIETLISEVTSKVASEVISQAPSKTYKGNISASISDFLKELMQKVESGGLRDDCSGKDNVKCLQAIADLYPVLHTETLTDDLIQFLYVIVDKIDIGEHEASDRKSRAGQDDPVDSDVTALKPRGGSSKRVSVYAIVAVLCVVGTVLAVGADHFSVPRYRRFIVRLLSRAKRRVRASDDLLDGDDIALTDTADTWGPAPHATRVPL